MAINVLECMCNWNGLYQLGEIFHKVVKVVHKRDPHDFYIGRPSILGNPFSHRRNTLAQFCVETREQAIAEFEKYAWDRMQWDVKFRDTLLACDGKTVGCWCKPKACHGDTFDRLIQRWRAKQGGLF